MNQYTDTANRYYPIDHHSPPPIVSLSYNSLRYEQSIAMTDNAEHEELTPSTESLLSSQVDENVTAEKPQAAEDGKEVKK
jgi:hypothetical protein